MTEYRSEIDGLRAIAVLSVILYHAKIIIFGKDWFEGGFVGVDIFFVISGYLISRIILTELELKNEFSVINFYERRARRILPMLLVVIAACVPFAWRQFLPVDLVDFAKSALSAMGFGSNFFFYFSTTKYGADSALLKPLLHTWSLGVEEQFYIIAPITLLIIWKSARTALLTLVIGMLILSLQFADVMEARNSELNFFLPISRFWELLAGSALAFVELKYGRLRHPILTQSLPIVGLFLIAHSILFFDADTPHPSFQTLTPVLGTALVLAFCSTEDFVGKVLSFKPIVGTGLISYSLYLWHFPIFAFGRVGTSIPSTYDKVEWIGAAFALSVSSYFLIEKTLRDTRIVSTKLFLSTMAVFVIGLSYLSFNFISKDGYESRLPPILLKKGFGGVDGQTLTKNNVKCHDARADFCDFNSQNERSITLLGDSHLSAISPTLIDKAKDYQIRLRNYAGCPAILNIDGTKHKKTCNHVENIKRFDWHELQDTIVVLGGRYPLYLEKTWFDSKEGFKEGNGVHDEFVSIRGLSLQEEFVFTVEKLLSKRNKVVLVYPIPEVGTNVQKYIFSLWQKRDVASPKNQMEEIFQPLTTSYEVYQDRTKSTFELFNSIQSPNIVRVYPHTLFCDKQIKGRCVTHDEDNAFYSDDDHPSTQGSEMIVKLIMDELRKADRSSL